MVRSGIIEVWTIYADESGGVDEIYLHGDGVNALFNAGDLSAEEFARAFVDACGIPEMELYARDVDPALIGLVGAAFTTGWAVILARNQNSLRCSPPRVFNCCCGGGESSAMFPFDEEMAGGV